MTCVITFDYDIRIVHEFDIGSQKARFEIVDGHVVDCMHAAQCNMDQSLRDSIIVVKHVNELCIVSYTYSYDLFSDQDK